MGNRCFPSQKRPGIEQAENTVIDRPEWEHRSGAAGERKNRSS
ncbi:hypothetical protein SD77_4368 [Bacillus badius]|uniref:Ribose 5-phosphate isomerase B n=1 Tax=Bacillus badius TaxID=1455 RepID=A0ABR5AVC2_BACBA|nr:hypothetical protein SD78_0673 [Bacillus badius]KIL78688.1 hypothetical protein SD77_4368 [Bacillus badius]